MDKRDLLGSLAGLIATMLLLLVPPLGVSEAAAVSLSYEAERQPAVSQLDGVLADHGTAGAEHVPGEVLVVFKPGVPPAVAEAYVSSIGASVIERMADSPSAMYRLAIGLSRTVLEAVDLLTHSPYVESASPNYVVHHDATVTGRFAIPNDTDFARQWGLNNAGRNLVGEPACGAPPPPPPCVGPPPPPPPRCITGNALGVIDADVDAPQAWRHTADCSREVVAVFDGGVDFAHPDFAGNAWMNPDTTTGDGFNNANAIIDEVANDVNGANFVSYEVLFERQESHAENINANNLFDAGEAIYWDVDRDGVVSCPDVLLSGPAQPNGTALVPFAPLDPLAKHAENVAADGVYTNGESIYVDSDNDNQVSAGDILVQGPAQAIGTALVSFRRRDFLVDPWDSVYLDPNGNRSVDAGDTLLAGNAAPVGGKLETFASLIRHTEDMAVNGIYDAGEAIYFDVDNNMQVSAGDMLLSGAGQPNGTPLINFVRRPNNDVSDQDGHGTSVASVIGARGDNNLDIAGVCWKVQLAAVKIATPDGASSADVIRGIQYVRALKTRATKPVNVRIINYSFSGLGFSPMTRAELSNANTDGILFVTTAGNNAIDNDGGPETIYRDADASGGVSAGDVRLTGTRDGGVTFPAGSTVAAGDGDIGHALVPFNANERHAENVAANGQYDEGEFIYRSAGAVVAAGDTRLTRVSAGGMQFGEGSIVAAGDPDIGTPLVPFLASERHDEVNPPDGMLATFQSNKPCTYDLPNILCVAATENRDNLASFSGWGKRSVHLAGPGVDILMLRRTADGGGTVYENGTSFAAPLVAGIAAHFWSLPAFETHTVAQLKDRLLTGLNGPLGLPHPHGVDPRFGVQGFVISGINNDGRSRMTMGDDFGDAPDAPYPTKLNKPAQNGARHEDIDEEWLGRTTDIPDAVVMMLNPPPRVPAPGDVSPEFDAFDDPTRWPPDPDGTGNLVAAADLDRYDDGIEFLTPFVFSQPGAPRQATVRVFVSTQNNGVVDFAGGRYDDGHPAGDGVHRPTDDKKIWVNGFFDWNGNGSFEDPMEQVFMLRVDPATWGINPGTGMPVKGAVYEITFPMPPVPAGPTPPVTWARFRLDYGENVGQELAGAPPFLPTVVGPSPGGTVRLWTDGLPVAGPQPNLYESDLYPSSGVGPQTLDLSRGLSQFGEVEDYSTQYCMVDCRTRGRFGNGAQLACNVVANDPGGTFQLGKNVLMSDGTSITGDSVKLGHATSVWSAFYNQLINTSGGIVRDGTGVPTLPVLNPFPSVPALTCGGPDVMVPPLGSLTLAPGSYGRVTVLKGGTLTLSPSGVFNFCSLRTAPGTPGAAVLVAGSGQTTINVVGTMRISDASVLRSQAGVPAALINVGGPLVRVGRGAELDAFVTGPNATFRIGKGGHIDGSFFMRECGTDKEVVCSCDFIPPIAVPTTTTSSTTTTTTL